MGRRPISIEDDDPVTVVATGSLVDEARQIAFQLAQREGFTTSPRVLKELQKHHPDIGDTRFMGVVFKGSGWTKDGELPEGSHRRKVARWRFARV